jgi:hypothetical protein
MKSTAMPASARQLVSSLLVAAVVCLPLVPPQHVHRAGIEGRTEALVHAHAPRPAAHDRHGGLALETSHGNHGLAVFLSSDCTSPSRVAISPDVAVMSAIGALSETVVTALRDTVGASIHGPPRLVGITRGPPPIV